MNGSRSWIALGLAAVIAATGCRGEAAERVPDQPESRVQTAAPDPVRTNPARRVEQELREVRAEILERVDSADEVLGTIPVLTPQERRQLRQDLNAEQIARAQALGERVSALAEIEQLQRVGRLVALEDSTHDWIVRKLNYSVPYVTPDTRTMLVEVGRRFRAELDSLGLPPYRIEITSVLRTPEDQAELRERNANASQGVSAHEFGTTVDIARAHFSAPPLSGLPASVASAPSLTPQIRQIEAAALDSAAEKHSSSLQAALGRVLLQMRDEGKLLVMMERRQAVYHITVAKRFGSAPRRG